MTSSTNPLPWRPVNNCECESLALPTSFSISFCLFLIIILHLSLVCLSLLSIAGWLWFLRHPLLTLIWPFFGSGKWPDWVGLGRPSGQWAGIGYYLRVCMPALWQYSAHCQRRVCVCLAVLSVCESVRMSVSLCTYFHCARPVKYAHRCTYGPQLMYWRWTRCDTMHWLW